MEWLYGFVGAAFLAGMGVIWKMHKDAIARIERDCEERDKRIWDQIGHDSHSGMRRDLHAMHGIPEAVIELDRRVSRIEGGER
jgi:hypothetical protein